MKKINFYQKGATAIEILVVLVILVLVIAVVLPRFSDMRKNQVLKAAVSDILSAIDKARSNTLASLDSSEYGVHFEEDEVIIFKGQSYSSGSSSNESISIISPASITSINLSGGTSNVYFNRLSGAPSASGTVVVGNGIISKTITISATGTASSN